MKNIDIIKQSVLFPIKYYKSFILSALLFLISELAQEHFSHIIADNIILMFLIYIILPLLALGISLQLIFHAIKNKKGFPKLSFKHSINEAAKDTLLESYYFILTLIVTILLSIPIGLFRNFNDASIFLSTLITELEHINPIEVIGTTPDILFINNLNPVILSLIIFIITFVIMFSLCTLGKIDLETNHNFKQVFNIKYILSKVNKIGIKKYLKFILLTIIICVIVANIVYLLKSSHMIGTIISAILESLSLFFFLHSFALLYPE